MPTRLTACGWAARSWPSAGRSSSLESEQQFWEPALSFSLPSSRGQEASRRVNTIKPVPKRRSDPEMQNYVYKGENGNGGAGGKGLKRSAQSTSTSAKDAPGKK